MAESLCDLDLNSYRYIFPFTLRLTLERSTSLPGSDVDHYVIIKCSNAGEKVTHTGLILISPVGRGDL